MLIDVHTFTKEGFTTGLAIKCENGLVLRTHLLEGGNLAWCGNKRKDEVETQFTEFIEALKKGGFEVNEM